jgi:alpha-methylacyl-CoA racemase
MGRTRDQWEAFARENDCCLEPVLELDEALGSELVGAREMVVEIDQPGAERAVRLLGVPVKLGRTPGDHARLPGPALGEHTEQVLRAAGYSAQEVTELLADGAAAGAVGEAQDISFQV